LDVCESLMFTMSPAGTCVCCSLLVIRTHLGRTH